MFFLTNTNQAWLSLTASNHTHDQEGWTHTKTSLDHHSLGVSKS